MKVKTVQAALEERIVPAVPIPFSQAGTVDVDLHEQYVQWMATQQVGGVAVWAHTGRGLLLSEEERAFVLEQWRRGMKGKCIICGTGIPTAVRLPQNPNGQLKTAFGAVHEMANEAKRGGADALLVYPPTALRGLADLNRHIVDYHAAVADVGLPFFAFFLYEQAGGIRYSVETLESLAALENFVGIKIATLDSVMTFQDVVADVARWDGAMILTGEDRFLGYSFEMGARSALIGLGAAATDQIAQLARTWFAHEFVEFHRHSRSIDDFARAIFSAPMEGYIQRMLWVLEADGVLSHRAYDRHAPPLPPAARTAVFDALLRLRSA